jgi:lysophospholipase L1-like esterase
MNSHKKTLKNRLVICFFISVTWMQLYSTPIFGQNKALKFEANDRVAFIGNSITHSGQYHSIIYLYYITRFPDKKITIFNNGISGDVAGDVLKRFDKDISVESPNVATIDLGMNDVQRNLYTENSNDNLAEKANARKLYIANIDKLISLLEKQHVKIILLIPSRFDQSVKSETPNKPRVNDALKGYGLILDSIYSARHLSGIVNFNSIMDSVSLIRQKNNPAFTLNGGDRIHPQYDGHFIMAYQFLKAQGAQPYVSKLVINYKSKSVKQIINGNIEKLKVLTNKISFSLKEKAIPFPLSAYSKDTSLVPFSQMFNQEIVAVNNLKPNTLYRLSIDGIQIGRYSGLVFNSGINIALNTLTPQQHQAEKLAKLNEQRNALLQTMRDVLLIKLRTLPSNVDDLTYNERKEYLDKKLENSKGKSSFGYFKSMTEIYLKNYQQINSLDMQAKSIVEELYRLNKPISHKYEIVADN